MREILFARNTVQERIVILGLNSLAHHDREPAGFFEQILAPQHDAPGISEQVRLVGQGFRNGHVLTVLP